MKDVFQKFKRVLNITRSQEIIYLSSAQKVSGPIRGPTDAPGNRSITHVKSQYVLSAEPGKFRSDVPWRSWRFTFSSLYTVVYVISLCGQCLMFGMSLFWLFHQGISMSNVTNSLFYSSSLISSMILLHMGWLWPKMIMKVEKIEAHLPPFSRNVDRLCNVTMIWIFASAVVEHLLSIVYGLAVSYSCSSENIIETYFRYNMPWIFDFTPFAVWKGVLSEIFNIQSTFMWSFNDLLIMVISIYLTEHLIMHNELLKTAVREKHFSAQTFRIQYLHIVRLVKLVNEQVGIYILTSFGCNLYWICTQLFYSLNNTKTGHFIACYKINPKNVETLHGIEHSVYFTYSFSFLVGRTLLVLLLAARIHSNSYGPLMALHGLPSEKFDIEVERFIAQINNIKVALSGLDFFYVTRNMILTLVGTIITYELVLLQFNK